LNPLKAKKRKNRRTWNVGPRPLSSNGGKTHGGHQGGPLKKKKKRGEVGLEAKVPGETTKKRRGPKGIDRLVDKELRKKPRRMKKSAIVLMVLGKKKRGGES